MVVAVCTFNRGPKLRRTLESLAALDPCSGRVARILIVDNNCTDDTPRLIDEFAASRPPIPVLRTIEPLQGLAAARRSAVARSSEPIIAFIDDDCLPAPDWAARTLAVFDAHPRAGMVGGRVNLEWESGPTRLARRCATMLAHQDLGDAPLRLDDPERALVGAAFALRRQALLHSGWLDQSVLTDRRGHELSSGGDFEMAIRIRAAGWEIRYTPDAAVRHLIPPERQTIAYLTRLARGVSRSKARLKWLARGRPGLDWARPLAARAERRRIRSALLEWRPSIRALKLAEHAARCEGWRELIQELSAFGSGTPDHRSGGSAPSPPAPVELPGGDGGACGGRSSGG